MKVVKCELGKGGLHQRIQTVPYPKDSHFV